MASLEGIRLAYGRISTIIKKTPLDLSHHLSQQLGLNLYLKKENVSFLSSYKERGALNKIMLLNEDEKQRGVICASAGNHGQAISHHSTRLGIKGIIVMPILTPWVKVSAVKRLGGQVLLHGNSYDEAYEKAMEIAEKEKMTYVSAFDDIDVIHGQGTVGLEILEQQPFIDACIAPIGGGGLIAGICLAIKEINPRVKVFGAESAAMPGMYESIRKRKLVKVPKKPTIADGIAVQQVGTVPFQVIQDRIEDIVLVDEEEIARAMLLLLEKDKTLVEGAGAVPVAALLSNKLPQLKGKNVAVVLSGGNVDMAMLGRIIERGLVRDKRKCRIQITLDDVPGALSNISTLLSSTRANIRSVNHERAFGAISASQTLVAFTLDIRGSDHLVEIQNCLTNAGYVYKLED